MTGTPHAVYDVKYHLVGAPKYQKLVSPGEIRERVRSIFKEIALNYGFEINAMGVADDRVDIFLPFPPRYSISKAVGIIKSVSVIFHEHPEVKKHLLPHFLIPSLIPYGSPLMPSFQNVKKKLLTNS